MDQIYIRNFFKDSFQNHYDFNQYKTDFNSSYVIEINGIKNIHDMYEQILLYAPESFDSNKKIMVTRSESKDGEYVKINNSNILKIEHKFKTNNLLLQNSISLKGYSLSEKSIKVNEWGDEDDKNIDIKFNKEEIEERYIFIKNKKSLILSEKKVIIKNDNDLSMLSLLLNFIYIGYPYILTQEREKKIRNSEILKNILELQTIFNYNYLSSKKNKISILIKDYFFTLPCIQFNINNEIFCIDCYDNIRKISEDNKEQFYLEECFLNVVTNEFTFLNTEAKIHSKIKSFDAIIYYDSHTRCYEIYTQGSNIYTDEIVNQIFTRYNYSEKKYNVDYISSFILSEKAMSKKKLKDTLKIINKFEIRYIIKSICNKFDIDYLLELPISYKEIIRKEVEKHPKTWISTFIYDILTLSYDEMKPILYDFNSTSDNLTDDIISNFHLKLDEELELEKLKIDDFHGFDKKKLDFYNSSTKLLDQFKFYSKDLEKRVHIKGSITNAWMKCWELIETFNLVPKNHSSDFTIFCNAEFPGAFILALNHYIKTQTTNKNYKWYANSLWPGSTSNNKEIFKDSFKLYEKHKNNWLMTAENGGSVIDPKMIQLIKNKLENKVDLYTSDIGTGVEANQEEGEAIFNLGQIICGLETLKEGGTMVCKMFLFFKPFHMSLLRLLSFVFENFYISKPMASRPGNSEIYIVGKGYKKDEMVIKKLYESLINWDKDTIYKFIEPITGDFYVKILYILYYIYKRQLYFLKKNMKFVNDLYDITTDSKNINLYLIKQNGKMKEIEERQKIVDKWKTTFKIPYLPKEDDLI